MLTSGIFETDNIIPNHASLKVVIKAATLPFVICINKSLAKRWVSEHFWHFARSIYLKLLQIIFFVQSQRLHLALDSLLNWIATEHKTGAANGFSISEVYNWQIGKWVSKRRMKETLRNRCIKSWGDRLLHPKVWSFTRVNAWGARDPLRNKLSFLRLATSLTPFQLSSLKLYF